MSAAPQVYLDHAATTPVDPEVAQAMGECLTLAGDFGNPAAAHDFGARAAARIAHARIQVAALLGAAAEDIVFTSGATEADNLAILGVARANADRGRHIVTARTEHKAVLDPCRALEREGFRVTWLAPGAGGVVEPAVLAAALRTGTTLVSIMCANNETGVLQDIAALGALCRARGVAFHSDCAQAAGRIALDVRALPVDFLSFTAHKLYGPKGIGALYVRPGAKGLLQPLMYGGGQERALRPGTPATHQIVGFGAACELTARALPTESVRLAALAERLWQGLEPLGGVHLNGAGAPRVPGILNVSFEGVEGESLLRALPGLALSAGAACNAASGDPSYVLRALGRGRQLAHGSLRFSLGRTTSEADIALAIATVTAAVERLRALSPAAPLAQEAADGWRGCAEAGERMVSGEGGGPGEDTWVRFELLVKGGIVKDARYRVFGCPHTMDAAEWLCGQLRGRPRAALIPGTPAVWAASRGVPAEKLGRLLLVEDALRACLAHWT